MSSSSVSTERAAPRWQRVLGNSVLLYPLVMHFLIVHDHLAAALAGLAAMGLVAAAAALQQVSGRLQALLYLAIATAALVCLGAGIELALYLPPIVFNLMFALGFARTLRPGAVPMVERFMRLHHGEELSPALHRYARRLTLAWTALFVAGALTAILLAVFASIESWSLFANVINYLLIAALFIGQFVYGYFRYRALRARQIVPTAMRMARRAARSGSFGH
jgi:uncharacterized membrane protein